MLNGQKTLKGNNNLREAMGSLIPENWEEKWRAFYLHIDEILTGG